MTRPLWLLATCAVLSGCGDGGSSLNPFRWFAGDTQRGPETLEPKGGYKDRADSRIPVPQVVSARWEPTVEGRMLVVTAMAPTKGWYNVALITETPQPEGRVRPGPDGVLRLRLVGGPPPAGSTAARLPASPGADTLTVAFPLSAAALDQIDSIVVTGAANAVSLKV